ncbi:Alpha/Beta hydrolase protein [Mycena galericulata]|nr:Alpha/Beta hydrolase protein [Mycena galericulata]
MLAFSLLLEPLREEITNFDVYYPPNTDKKHPILIYVHGGGIVNGSNLGLYFAKRGFVTIIPDYRLAPGTTFPGPAEDIRDAVSWAVAHSAELGPDADVGSVFLLGHSAGGVHTLTLLLSPFIRHASAQRLPIKGALISSVPSHFPPTGGSKDPWVMYYGSSEATQEHEPLALVNAAAPELIKGLPPLSLMKCERDPDWFKLIAKDFDVALAEKGVAPKQIVAEGHNHISPAWALGTGQGEKWAEEFMAWMESL